MNRHTAVRFQAEIEKPIAMLACAVNSLTRLAFRLPQAGEKKRGRSRVQAWRPFDEESLLAPRRLVIVSKKIETKTIN
jgi:hypothetical protein